MVDTVRMMFLIFEAEFPYSHGRHCPHDVSDRPRPSSQYAGTIVTELQHDGTLISHSIIPHFCTIYSTAAAIMEISAFTVLHTDNIRPCTHTVTLDHTRSFTSLRYAHCSYTFTYASISRDDFSIDIYEQYTDNRRTCYNTPHSHEATVNVPYSLQTTKISPVYGNQGGR